MPSDTVISASDSNISVGHNPPTRSVFKRALVGIMLLFMMSFAGAWLMHASIEAEADEPQVSATADPAR